MGALITWDTRNNAFAPDKGFFGELNISTYKKIFGSHYSFTTFTLDMRKFLTLNKNQVIAFRALMKLNKGKVPFRNLSFLGGTDMMRGYYKGRFADNDMMEYQAELRQHLFWRIGMTGFAAVGQVTEDYGDFRFRGFHFAYGGGLRFMLRKNEKLNLRIDYGRGNHSDGLYILL
jgi:outer membrane protein assembly factor BamA